LEPTQTSSDCLAYKPYYGIFRFTKDIDLVLYAKDVKRRKAFLKARLKSQEGSIDEHIDFLSQNMELIEFVPSKWVTTTFLL
jgi:hypothetical protein